jgi:hypothetical protein
VAAVSEEKQLLNRFPTARSASALRGRGPFELVMQRIGVVVLLSVVVVACLGFLGPYSRTVSASSAAGSMEVTYDAVTRRGLESEVVVLARSTSPLDSFVLTIDQQAMADLGIDHIAPEPTDQQAHGSKVLLEFVDPRGDEFEVRLSGRTPTQQPPTRRRWELQWLTDTDATSLTATTWVVP